MKRLYSLFLLAAALTFGLQSCSNNDDLYNEVPSAINTFISHYYPNSSLESFSSTASGYTVVIKDGPGITFGKNYAWTSIDGYGSAIPQVFLFDELPPALYAYLQETQNLDSVFAITRTEKEYTLKLLNSTLTYDCKSGNITGSAIAS